MTLAFQNGRCAADALRPLAHSNPYLKNSKAHRDFCHGYLTAPVYGVAPPRGTVRQEAASIAPDDACRRLALAQPEWGPPARAVAWFSEQTGALYAMVAEWDLENGSIRRVELKRHRRSRKETAKIIAPKTPSPSTAGEGI
jgi:hypothetical protein